MTMCADTITLRLRRSFSLPQIDTGDYSVAMLQASSGNAAIYVVVHPYYTYSGDYYEAKILCR